MPQSNFSNRSLYHADNLDVLRGMNSESVHLIATDPPFNKSKDFHATPDSLARGARFQDRWRWIEDVHDDWLTEIMRDFPEVYAVISTTREVYGSDMAAFLAFLGIRLIEMRRVLRDDGSVYLHCDDTAGQYLKLLLDAIFGKENFRNAIVWKRATAHNDAKRYGRILDYILFYTKGETFTWNVDAVSTPKDESELIKAYPSKDERGRYRSDNITGADTSGGESGTAWKGYDVTAKGRHWAPPLYGKYAEYIERNFIPDYRGIQGVHARLDALDGAGLIHHPQKGFWPGLKRYAAADPGNPPQNLFTEPIGFTNYSSRKGEYIGYPTQKPLALYERIIKASSNPGDIVLDPFAGCATTPIAAERLGRQWVGIDIWEGAYQTVLHRLQAEGLAVKDAVAASEAEQANLLTFGDVHYLTTPPKRTDYEDPMPYFQTPTAQTRRRYPPPRQQHQRLLDDIGAYCQGCGANYTFDPRVLEVDHIRPKADGGSDAYDNLTLLCPPCNRAKSDRLALTGLQMQNRKDGYLKPENEPNLRHGNPNRRRAATRRRRR